MTNKAQHIIDFWFNKEHQALWWQSTKAFDQRIKNQFEQDITKLINGEYDHWQNEPTSTLAGIILIDQFCRNIYRNSENAFSHDAIANHWCKSGIEKKFDQELSCQQRIFFYLPLEHSELLADQELSLHYYQKLLNDAPEHEKSTYQSTYDFAKQHYDAIKKFNRFPHRNKALGREDHPDEIKHLKQHGGFGGY